jgi:hypothetical protein
MSDFVHAAEEAGAKMEKIRKANNILDRKQKELDLKALGPVDKRASTCLSFTLQESTKAQEKETKFLIMGRVVTPLFVGKERCTVPSLGEVLPAKSCTLQKIAGKRTAKEIVKLEDSAEFLPNSVVKGILKFLDNEMHSLTESKILVTNHFAIRVLQIKDNELKDICCKLGVGVKEDKMNVRIIKPAKEFYNQLIALCLKYGVFDLNFVSAADFVEAAKHSLNNQWSEKLKIPTEHFYKLCVEEAEKCTSVKSEDEFFEKLKCRLLHDWNKEILDKSHNFKRKKLD